MWHLFSIVDGKLIKSCLMPAAKVNGSKIETVESLGTPDKMSEVQKAFCLTEQVNVDFVYQEW